MCPWTEAAHCNVCETFVCKKYTHFFMFLEAFQISFKWKDFSTLRVSRALRSIIPWNGSRFFFTENEKFFMSSTASRVFFHFKENLLAESWKDWEKESPIWCFDDVLSLSRAHDLPVFRSRSAQRPDVFKIYIYDLLCSCVLRCEKKSNRIRGRKWTRKKRT